MILSALVSHVSLHSSIQSCSFSPHFPWSSLRGHFWFLCRVNNEKRNFSPVMDLSPFKMDIDELIEEFVQNKATTLAGMKNVWLSRKFSYIYEACRSTNLSLYMQSLYAHSIGHMISDGALSRRLGGLYCLFCLYETQPFKPPFKIYLSLGELKKLKQLVSEAKAEGIRVVPALVKLMLDKNVFLFGFVDLNYGSVTEICQKLTRLQNERIQVAHEKLFANSKLDSLLGMDMGQEFDLEILKKMSAEYEEAKKLAIEGAEKVVDNEPFVDEMEKITRNWDAEKELFKGGTVIEQGEEETRQANTEEPQMQGQDEEEPEDAYDEFFQLLQNFV